MVAVVAVTAATAVVAVATVVASAAVVAATAAVVAAAVVATAAVVADTTVKAAATAATVDARRLESGPYESIAKLRRINGLTIRIRLVACLSCKIQRGY